MRRGGCFLVLALMLLASAPLDAGAGEPARSIREIAGTAAERVSAVSLMIAKRRPLPSALLDAHFVEQQVGDGFLGPSDFTSFCALTVAVADVPAWRAAMAPLEPPNSPPRHAVPAGAPPWWASPADFKALEFYSPGTFGGRAHGWIGIHAGTGRIFIYTFTM